jgi:hypothetical protein
MGFMQDTFPALTPALTKEIDARFRRADDTRDSAEVRRHKQWMAEQKADKPDPVAKQAQDWMRDQSYGLSSTQAEPATKDVEPTCAPPAANDNERDLRRIALEWALEDSDGRTTHSIIERASAFLSFLKGEAAA